jgi:hypothetical protein
MPLIKNILFLRSKIVNRMNKITLTMKNLIKSFLFVSILCLSFIASAQGETEFIRKSKTLTAPTCVLYADDYEGANPIITSQTILNRIEAGGTPCSTFIVNYSGFTPEAQAAFQFAVDIWSMSIESTQPITISANFEPLDPGVLGQAGAVSVHTSNSPGAVPNVFYPKALAEKLDDVQINPDPFGGSVDISASFSSTFNWYYGTDSNPPGGQFDFVSVVLHELGHGLGLGTSFRTTDGVTGGIREPNNMIPTVYDLAMENGSGESLLDTAIFTDPSTAIHSQLTGNNLFNNATISKGQNGGVIPKVYAPSTFQGGSSYSHWDSETFPITNENTLMTPSIGPGVAVHNPGPITLGLFEDMGWNICGGSLTTEDFTLDTVEVSPNPFTSSITVKLSNGLNDNYNINVFDINGRIILSETKVTSNGTMTISNLDQLEDALYFVKITNERSGANITKKVIKN